MITTTTTPATTAHACTLAGGIRASLAPAVFGWTLTLSDGEPRILVLAIHPERMQALADWEPSMTWVGLPHGAGRVIRDMQEFCKEARIRGGTHGIFDLHEEDAPDRAALRGLAAAALGEGDR